MAQNDWSVMEGSVDGTDWNGITIRRGITNGIIPRPPLANDFIYGFNSIQAVQGAVGVSCMISNYGPIAPRPTHVPDSDGGGGGSIAAAIKKGVSGGKTGYSGFLFMGSGINSVEGEAYLLGFENANPSRVVLAKGPINRGIPSIASPGSTKILRYSAEAYDWDVWHQLRLDAVVNDNGDVILVMSKSNLEETEDVNNPVWEPIICNDGLEFSDGFFVDDALAVNTGSLPFLSGFCGFGFYTAQSARRAYFDHIQVMRQNPEL